MNKIIHSHFPISAILSTSTLSIMYHKVLNFNYKSILIFLIFFRVAVPTLHSQSVYQPIIYQAYISGNMNKWASVISIIEKENFPNADRKLELLSYYYGYIGYLLGTKKHEHVEHYIIKGEKLIAEILKKSPENATAYAFRGSFIGFRIGLSKFKAITLGSESNENIEKAYKIDPFNVQAIVDKGNALYHTPKLFGGDKKEALKLFLQAARLLEKNAKTTNNWFYLNVLTLIAKAQENFGQINQALMTYDKILHLEPNYQWVKNELYPSCKLKLK